MKPGRAQPRRVWILFAGTAAVAVLAGLAIYYFTGVAAQGLAASVAAILLWVPALRDALRRRDDDLLREALTAVSPAARRWLLAHYHHYRRLPAPLRADFDEDVGHFLAQKRITGVSFELTDAVRLGVAASAVTLSLSWRDYNWEQLTEVLVYPDDFDRDFGFDEREFAGQAHPWGTVLLSAPALEESFADPEDAFHVGLHEFAHLLNLLRQEIGGVPAGLSGPLAQAWRRLADVEMARLRGGDSLLDPYGGHDPVEFFAVAVEAFFERPQGLRREHAELYTMLSGYFGQDPAAWDDTVGLDADRPADDHAQPRRAAHATSRQHRQRRRLSSTRGDQG